MTYVVMSPCVGCKDTKCVAVCPVDCFYEVPEMLAISPDECIDCGLCEPECPVDAILHEDEVPNDEIPFIEINAKGSEVWPNIDEPKEPMAHKSPYTTAEAIKVIQLD